MNWIYILVLCLSIYYIVARYLEKHIDNFDPSLVPVSSIVTLAKVAQKLVDGNGTLTNPGNLQIGNPGVGTTGNLRVTGTTTLDGATTVGGTLGVTGQSEFKNTINLISTNTDNKYTIHTANDFTRITNKGGESIILFKQDKNVEIPNGLTVSGNTTIGGSTTIYRDLTVVYGGLRGADGERVGWMDSGWTKISTRSNIEFWITPATSKPKDPNQLLAGIDINGFYTYSPNNKKSARFVSDNNGDILLKDSKSDTKFRVDENGIAYSDGINTKSAQINGNLNVTGNTTLGGTVTFPNRTIRTYLSGTIPGGTDKATVYTPTAFPYTIDLTIWQIQNNNGVINNCAYVNTTTWTAANVTTNRYYTPGAWSTCFDRNIDGKGNYTINANNPGGYTIKWVATIDTYNF